MPDIGPGNAIVTSTNPTGGPYVVTFGNTLGNGSLPLLQVNNYLSGGAPTISITTAGGRSATIAAPIQDTAASVGVFHSARKTLARSFCSGNTCLAPRASLPPVTVDQGILDLQSPWSSLAPRPAAHLP